MSTENPAAFPHDEKDGAGEHWHSHLGMSLRDWFAGQAAHAALHLATEIGCYEASPCPQAARLAYEMADAMLAERAKDAES